MGIGFDAGAPVGRLSGFSNVMLGATANLQYKLSNNMALNFTTGIYEFLSKSRTYTFEHGTTIGAGLSTITYNTGNQAIIPFKAGVKMLFTKNLYYGIEAGILIGSSGGNYSYAYDVSPAIGYAYKSWDFSIRYEDFFLQENLGFIGLRLAYGFHI